jgi:hypothetical protein
MLHCTFLQTVLLFKSYSIGLRRQQKHISAYESEGNAGVLPKSICRIHKIKRAKLFTPREKVTREMNIAYAVV